MLGLVKQICSSETLKGNYEVWMGSYEMGKYKREIEEGEGKKI